jgi:hypothetical protein
MIIGLLFAHEISLSIQLKIPKTMSLVFVSIGDGEIGVSSLPSSAETKVPAQDGAEDGRSRKTNLGLLLYMHS